MNELNIDLCKKRFEVDKKRCQNDVAQIKNAIHQLDVSYNIQLEDLLIQLEYAELELTRIQGTNYIQEYGLEEFMDDEDDS